MTYADLERRYNSCIPQRELDAVRWPTLEAQIKRAHAQINEHRRKAHERMLQWRLELSVALGGIKLTILPAYQFSAILDARRRVHDVHRPHVRYHSRTAVRWTEHLGKLLIRQAHRLAKAYPDNDDRSEAQVHAMRKAQRE